MLFASFSVTHPDADLSWLPPAVSLPSSASMSFLIKTLGQRLKANIETTFTSGVVLGQSLSYL